MVDGARPEGTPLGSRRDPFGTWKACMKFYLYIIFSQSANRWYVGSSNNIQDRLRRHNSGSSKSTKPYCPWVLAYFEEYNTRSEAVRREYYLKSTKGYKDLLEIKYKINPGGFA